MVPHIKRVRFSSPLVPEGGTEAVLVQDCHLDTGELKRKGTAPVSYSEIYPATANDVAHESKEALGIELTKQHVQDFHQDAVEGKGTASASYSEIYSATANEVVHGSKEALGVELTNNHVQDCHLDADGFTTKGTAPVSYGERLSDTARDVVFDSERVLDSFKFNPFAPVFTPVSNNLDHTVLEGDGRSQLNIVLDFLNPASTEADKEGSNALRNDTATYSYGEIFSDTAKDVALESKRALDIESTKYLVQDCQRDTGGSETKGTATVSYSEIGPAIAMAKEILLERERALGMEWERDLAQDFHPDADGSTTKGTATASYGEISSDTARDVVFSSGSGRPQAIVPARQNPVLLPVPSGFELGDFCNECSGFVGISCQCWDGVAECGWGIGPSVLREPILSRRDVETMLQNFDYLSAEIVNQILSRYPDVGPDGRQLEAQCDEEWSGSDLDSCYICGGLDRAGEAGNDLSEREGGCGRILHVRCAQAGHLCLVCPEAGCCMSEESDSDH